MTDIYSNKDAEIQNALMKEAQKLYGNNVQIINIHYEMKTGALGAAAAVLSYNHCRKRHQQHLLRGASEGKGHP